MTGIDRLLSLILKKQKNGKFVISWRVLALISILGFMLLSVYMWQEIVNLKQQLRAATDKGAQIEGQLAQREKEFIGEQLRLTQQLDEALNRAESARLDSSPRQIAAEVPPKFRSSPSLPTDAEAGRTRRSMWRAQRAVGDIEELMALSSSEKENLVERTQQAYASQPGPLAPEDRARIEEQIVVDVLGHDRARQYATLKKEAEQREFDDTVNKDVIVMSRQLSLSPTQEKDVRDALVQAEQVIVPMRAQIRLKMQEAMSLHFEGDAGRELLQTQYDEIKNLRESLKREKDQALLNALEGKLSDQQKNQLLALQAQER